MTTVTKYLVLCILITLVDIYQCGRYSGGSQDVSEIQYTVGTERPEVVPFPALAYRTTARHARPTTRRTTQRPTTRRSTTRRTTPRPSTHRSTPRPSTHRTVHSTHAPISYRTTPRPTTRRTTPTHRTVHSTRAPVTYRTTPRPTTRKTTPRPTTRRTTTRTTPKPKYTHPPRFTTRRPNTITRKEWTVDSMPPVPGSGKSTKTTYVVKNIYNYHYPGFYTIPVQNHAHPGYYQTYSSYHYTPSDTGSGILGFYLGYKLAKLTTPTFSHASFYDGYRPRYDHYTVHHYYHNADSVPKQQRVAPDAIRGCVGDSTSVCPANTMSLCTTDGTLMCVVAVSKLVTCVENGKTVNCTRSTISCVNNTAPECGGKNQGNVTVNIPCVSTANVEGPVKYVNNTIVVGTPENIGSTNCTRFIPCTQIPLPQCVNKTHVMLNVSCDQLGTTFSIAPGTNQTLNCSSVVSCVNNTTPECSTKTNTTVGVPCSVISINGTQLANTSTNNETFACQNNTISCVNNLSPECLNKTFIVANVTCTSNSTQGGMKYVDNPESANTTNTTSVYWKWKRSVPPVLQDFCVTVVAMPSQRVPTEGEEFLQDASSLLEKFFEAVWNL